MSRSVGEALGINRFKELANRCEGIAGSDRDEGVIAFNGVHVGFGSFNECPGRVGCFYVSHCNYRVLLFGGFIRSVQHPVNWEVAVPRGIPVSRAGG